MKERVNILGVFVDRVTMHESVARVMEYIASAGAFYVVTPNAEIIECAQKDKQLLDALNGGDLSIPDGVGVIKAAKILGDALPEKVPGCELCRHVIGELDTRGGSLYLLGGRPGVAEKAAKNISRVYPNIKIAGTQDGYFKDEGAALAAIRAAKPDVLLVCLGAPKQEYFMAAHKKEFEKIVMIGAGGTIDILAGQKERAPQFYIDHGLEWLYRLKKEPRRIGRMLKLPVFGMKVLIRKVIDK